MKYSFMGNCVIKRIVLKSDDSRVINTILSKLLGIRYCSLIIYRYLMLKNLIFFSSRKAVILLKYFNYKIRFI